MHSIITPFPIFVYHSPPPPPRGRAWQFHALAGECVCLRLIPDTHFFRNILYLYFFIIIKRISSVFLTSHMSYTRHDAIFQQLFAPFLPFGWSFSPSLCFSGLLNRPAINALNFYITLCMAFLAHLSMKPETNALKVSIIKTAAL